MFVDTTQGNDKAHHSSAYMEMTGNQGTHCVNFSSPIEEGQANMLVVESQVHPKVKGHGNDQPLGSLRSQEGIWTGKNEHVCLLKCFMKTCRRKCNRTM